MTSIPLIEPDSLAVQTHDLGKRFGTRAALDSVDLDVPRGCAFGFLGANGAGKTTLIRLLLGLAEPTPGRMRLLGRDLPGGRAAALARVGAIIEEPRFHLHLTGRDLDVHAAARERSAHGRIDGALARVGLAARAVEREGVNPQRHAAEHARGLFRVGAMGSASATARSAAVS
jgi:ABC-2 type transport system ATP-binding protein